MERENKKNEYSKEEKINPIIGENARKALEIINKHKKENEDKEVEER